MRVVSCGGRRRRRWQLSTGERKSERAVLSKCWAERLIASPFTGVSISLSLFDFLLLENILIFCSISWRFLLNLVNNNEVPNRLYVAYINGGTPVND